LILSWVRWCILVSAQVKSKCFPFCDQSWWQASEWIQTVPAAVFPVLIYSVHVSEAESQGRVFISPTAIETGSPSLGLHTMRLGMWTEQWKWIIVDCSEVLDRNKSRPFAWALKLSITNALMAQINRLGSCVEMDLPLHVNLVAVPSNRDMQLFFIRCTLSRKSNGTRRNNKNELDTKQWTRVSIWTVSESTKIFMKRISSRHRIYKHKEIGPILDHLGQAELPGE
jgi:hypothetical protein